MGCDCSMCLRISGCPVDFRARQQIVTGSTSAATPCTSRSAAQRFPSPRMCSQEPRLASSVQTASPALVGFLPPFVAQSCRATQHRWRIVERVVVVRLEQEELGQMEQSFGALDTAAALLGSLLSSSRFFLLCLVGSLLPASSSYRKRKQCLMLLVVLSGEFYEPPPPPKKQEKQARR